MEARSNNAQRARYALLVASKGVGLSHRRERVPDDAWVRISLPLSQAL